ncbi:hypothetical protein OQA88_9082 [Cercophora sp. LCS_1]
MSPTIQGLNCLRGLDARTMLATGAGVLVFAIFISYVRSWYRLRHIPGPFLNSISALTQLRGELQGSSHLYYDDMQRKYGSLVRIGPKTVLTADPDYAQRTSAVRSPYTRGYFYKGARLEPGKDNIVSITDDDAHTEMRKRLAPGYTGSEIPGGFEAAVDRTIASLIHLLESKHLSTDTDFRPFDFAPRIQYFTLDLVSEVACSKPFGNLQHDDDIFDYIDATRESIPFLIATLAVEGLSRVTQTWPLSRFMPNTKDKRGIGRAMREAETMARHRLTSGSQGERDILTSWIKQKLTIPEIGQQVGILVLAGTDSTSAAIRWVFLHIITNPPVLARLLAEIDTAIAAGKISSPVTNAEAVGLPYLQATIREGLRMVSPATGLFYKQVPEGGDVVDGYYLPAGTQVGTNLWGMLRRNTKVYGEDCGHFRPERWLTEDADKFRAMAQTLDLIFGHGKYQCLGKRLALMELNKIFVELFRRFEFTITDPMKPVEAVNISLWFIKNMNVKMTRRSR